MSTSESNRRLDRILGSWDENPAAARAALIEHAHDRVRDLAGRMLRKSYARVAAYEETDDVLQNACLRLSRMLEDVQPTSADHFLRLSTLAISRTLKDLVDHHFGPHGAGANFGASLDDSGAPSAFGADSSEAPHRLARWDEFHRRLESLADETREVFKLRWYHDMTIPEIAARLRISERSVNRRLLEAKLALAGYFEDEDRADGFVRRS